MRDIPVTPGELQRSLQESFALASRRLSGTPTTQEGLEKFMAVLQEEINAFWDLWSLKPEDRPKVTGEMSEKTITVILKSSANEFQYPVSLEDFPCSSS